MNLYTMGEVAKRFDVQNNTVRRWAKEYFPDFMSESAKPREGGYHKFNDMDLGVFATWVRLQGEGKSIEDARAALRNGERDVPPDAPMSEAQKNMVMNQTVVQIQKLQQEVLQLEQRIEELTNALSEEKRQTALEEGQKTLALTQLASAQELVRELIAESALLKHKLDN